MDKLVFIIDDDQVYLNFMKGHFRQMGGYQVEVYAKGDLALKELETRIPFMIILDHNLADVEKDGIYFLKKIRKMNSNVPILYITSDSTEEVRGLASKYGARSLIVKSESFLVQLRTAIDEISAPKKGLFAKIFK